MDNALLDSEEVFKQRLARLGLGQVEPAFERQGWTTYANFGFATAYNPAKSSEAEFELRVVAPLLGRERKLIPAVRRLYLESYALAAKEVRDKTATTTAAGAATEELPGPERERRRKELSKLLAPGLVMGPLDPSIHLIDLAHGSYTRDKVEYIDWSECTDADADLQRGPPNKIRTWDTDAKGYLKQVEVEDDAHRPIHPEKEADPMYQLMRALRRRGMAYHVSRRMS